MAWADDLYALAGDLTGGNPDALFGMTDITNYPEVCDAIANGATSREVVEYASGFLGISFLDYPIILTYSAVDGNVSTSWDNTETSTHMSLNESEGNSFCEDLANLIYTNYEMLLELVPEQPSADDSVAISYAGSQIATMTGAGANKQLLCNGELMSGNVTITKTGSSSVLTVTYNNSNIVNSATEDSYTLNCSGKVMASNVVVTLT